MLHTSFGSPLVAALLVAVSLGALGASDNSIATADSSSSISDCSRMLSADTERRRPTIEGSEVIAPRGSASLDMLEADGVELGVEALAICSRLSADKDRTNGEVERAALDDGARARSSLRRCERFEMMACSERWWRSGLVRSLGVGSVAASENDELDSCCESVLFVLETGGPGADSKACLPASESGVVLLELLLRGSADAASGGDGDEVGLAAAECVRRCRSTKVEAGELASSSRLYTSGVAGIAKATPDADDDDDELGVDGSGALAGSSSSIERRRFSGAAARRWPSVCVGGGVEGPDGSELVLELVLLRELFLVFLSRSTICIAQ